MLGLLLFVGIGIVGYVVASRFVQDRLRFVDAIHSPVAPILAGVGAALVTWPLAALPIITTGMSAIFGLGAGFGTRHGARALRRGAIISTR